MNKFSKIRPPYGEWAMSASQMSTFSSCPRKWRLQKVERAKEENKTHFDVGTCLHAACENDLQGLDRG